jgi:hypothetical protein
MADRPDLTLLPGGRDETALPRLQAEFPGYTIVETRDHFRGMIILAARNPDTERGPLVVMAEDADEMRKVLNEFP